MAIDFDVGTHRRCTLYTRHEYHGNALSNEARAGRQLITSAGLREFTRDTRQLARLVEFMRNARSGAYASSAAPEQTARALQNAVERGDVIAVVPRRVRRAEAVRLLSRRSGRTTRPSRRRSYSGALCLW
ncbi:hypothetical protein OKW26_007809 [Paraburkholderia sp. 32]